MKILMSIFILMIILFSGCSIFQGFQGLGDDAVERYNQTQIERELTNGTALEEQNMTVTRSLIEAIANLKRLQDELNSLSNDIENISIQIENVQNDSSLNSDTIEYLKYLNELAMTSNAFMFELQSSTRIWNLYLNKMMRNSNKLDFEENESPMMIVDSITDPLVVFE